MLDGKVAIVTGAGRGLGRVEALELARLGARVVVNDLGTKNDGSGSDKGPAEAVVEEIRKSGGEAISQFGDVADWNDAQTLIARAMDAFGALHILVNNAGFLRDRMIFNMSEEDFDAVIRVHLKGHFCTMRFATAYWREQSKAQGAPVYGRLISTASEAFLFASPGQPNYAAAKSGIVAMTLSAAQACAKYGVTGNIICPRARTRMTDSGRTGAMFAAPESGFDTFAPENIAPLVGYLASPDAARISGQVFILWGKQLQRVQAPSPDAHFETDDAWTPESLHKQLGPYFEKLEPLQQSFIFRPG